MEWIVREQRGGERFFAPTGLLPETTGGLSQKVVFVIAIRVAGSNPGTGESLDRFTLRVRDDENRPDIPNGTRGTPPKTDF
ncbi:MAG: hypothetical protein LBP56_08915 [Odoribacteraceae bacterium]|jgi:hypothetical protein|nr:hypothetical protein [Odoribacteraceae bacterium]